jgi:hypothetical protein
MRPVPGIAASIPLELRLRCVLCVDERASPVTVIVSSRRQGSYRPFTVATKFADKDDAVALEGSEAGKGERQE